MINYDPRGSAAWSAPFTETELYAPPVEPDVVPVALEQHSAIDTTQIPAWNTGYYYNLQGGGFRLKIENRGPGILESVCCNISFGANEDFLICVQYNTFQRCFDGLHLASGESAWLDFGDVDARVIAHYPTDLCFWTSSPNERPDAHPADDVFCKPFSLKVAAAEPVALPLQLFPNPASVSATLRLPQGSDAKRWQLADVSGRIVAQGDCLPGGDVSVQTAHLPGGIYFLRAGGHMAKLAVRH